MVFEWQLHSAPSWLDSAILGPTGNPRLRIGDYVQSWIDEREALGELRHHTAAGYRDRVRLDILRFPGYVPLSRVSPPMIQALYRRLLTQRRLAPATVRQAASILYASLKEAVARRLS